jgi:hypothetical protein
MTEGPKSRMISDKSTALGSSIVYSRLHNKTPMDLPYLEKLDINHLTEISFNQRYTLKPK